MSKRIPTFLLGQAMKDLKIADADEEDGLNTTPQHLNELVAHHPELVTMWNDLKEKMDAPIEPIEQPSYITVPLLPFQRAGVAWMMRQEKDPDFQGGVLADEMGKKIQAITLLLSDNTKPNLVVTSAATIMQWSSEIEKFAVKNVKVHLYHGPKAKRASTLAELESYDIVITTYPALADAYRKSIIGHIDRPGQSKILKTPSLLHSVRWNRVVADDAKTIEDYLDNTARAVFDLKSNYNWALTGAPLQEYAYELYSLVKFIKPDPWAYFYCKECPCKRPTWGFVSGSACANCGHGPMDHISWWKKNIDKSQLLQRMTLRRTKAVFVPHQQ
ncbi:SNF2 family N-terminal domain-containing protein [Gongronella butleri]|nr:SNF2 family N-terminal domain-containing protein [Gongronella butleri]